MDNLCIHKHGGRRSTDDVKRASLELARVGVVVAVLPVHSIEAVALEIRNTVLGDIAGKRNLKGEVLLLYQFQK